MPLPPALAAAFARRLSAPPSDPAALRAAVARHLDRVSAAWQRDALVDRDLARAIATACHALLDLWPTLGPDGRAHVQAACTWFADEDDAEPDLDSVVGFDDDALVVAEVATYLGRPDLRVEIG